MSLYKRISFLLLLLPFIAKAQIPVPRGPATILERDARLQGYLNLVLPRYSDTTAANTQKGLDSLGSVIYTDADTTIWLRGVNSVGTKTWRKIAGTGGVGGYSDPLTTLGDMLIRNSTATTRLGGNTTSVLQVLSQTGTGAVSAVPLWYTPTLTDVSNWLGFTPENTSNKSTSTSLGTSNTFYPSQNAVKTYVDAQIAGISSFSNIIVESGIYALNDSTIRLGTNPFKENVHLSGSDTYDLYLDSAHLIYNKRLPIQPLDSTNWKILVEKRSTGEVEAMSWPTFGGGGSPANPTASVGLTAVNGSASTYMRSDAAPALSQSIIPTWTGKHTFNVAPQINVSATTGYVWTATDGSGNGNWAAAAGGMTNPMTTTGDIIYSSSGSTPARRGIGSTGDVLTVAGGVPTWTSPGGSVLSNIYEATNFGILFDSVSAHATANTTAWRSMISSVPNGSIIRLPAGTCYIDDTIAIRGKSLQIFSNANALQIGCCGVPGNYGASTQIIQLTHNKDAFVVNVDPPTATGYDKGVSMQGFAILADTAGNPTFTSGAAVRLDVGGSFYMKDMQFNFFYIGVNVVDNSTYWTIDHCSFWGLQKYSIKIACPANPDQGDWTIINNVFYSPFNRNSTAGIYWESSGGGKIFSNKWNGGYGGFKMQYAMFFNMIGQTSDLTIEGNSIENYDSSAIKFRSTNVVFQNMQIVGNQMSGNSAKGPTLDLIFNPTPANRGLIIDGNLIGDFGTLGDTAVEVSNISFLTIGHNSVSAGPSPYWLLNNVGTDVQIDYTNYRSANVDVGTAHNFNGTSIWQISNQSSGASARAQFEIDAAGSNQVGMVVNGSGNSNPNVQRVFGSGTFDIVSDNGTGSGGSDPIRFSPGGNGNVLGYWLGNTNPQLIIGGGTTTKSTTHADLYINKGAVNDFTGMDVRNTSGGSSAATGFVFDNGTQITSIQLNGTGYSSGYGIASASQLYVYQSGNIGLQADGGIINFSTAATASSGNLEIARFSTGKRFLIGRTTDDAVGLIQSTSTSQPQAAFEYDGTHYTQFQTFSNGGMSITLNGAASTANIDLNIPSQGSLNFTNAGAHLTFPSGTGSRASVATLSSGTVTMSMPGAAGTTLGFVQMQTPSGTTLTTHYQVNCTGGSCTIQANLAAGTINTADNSTLQFFFVN